MPEHQTGKVCVQTLISGDQFITEGESWHQSPLLKPENGGKTSREENSFNRSKCNNSLCIGCVVGVDPTKSPLSFLLDGGECLYGIEEVVALLPVLDVGVDQEAVHLAVDVLHHDLEPVETSGFWNLNLLHEPLDQIFVDNSVRGSKECQNMRNEIFFILLELSIPVFSILKIKDINEILVQEHDY